MKSLHIILVFLTICFLVPKTSFTQDQTRTVSGIVKDLKSGQGLQGVSVQSRVSGQTSATDNDGSFVISVSSTDTLEFSYVGYKLHLEPIGTRHVLEIQLSEDESTIDEVTVVAFGTQKKSSVVGAITTVNARDLQGPSSNLTSAFAGRIPGLIAFSPSGEPGADNAQFFVRGVTTFGYQASPLILIDGFESTTDNLARLQPDDIESFSILKDASATVLYGARGANGIIMVQTKAGKEGPVQLSARLDVNVSMPVQMIDMLDGVDYMRLYNEARINRNPLLGNYYAEQKIQSTLNGENPMVYPNTDWYSTLFNKSTNNKKANINLSGGGQVATYYVAMGVDKESGLLKVDKKNNFNNNIDIGRYNIRSNVLFKLTPTTKLDTRLQSRFERYNGPFASATSIFNMVMNINPVDFPAVYQPDPANEFTEHILFGSSFTSGQSLMPNPYAQMVRGYEDRNETTIIAQATLSQDLDFITKGLKFQGKASANTWSRYASRRSYNPYYYDLEWYNQVTEDYKLMVLNPTSGQPYLGNVTPIRDAHGHFYFEARVNWDRVFGRHTISAMTVGMMEEKLLTGGNSTSIYETLPERNMGNSGRLSYGLDDTYFAEFAYGFNGSEKFTGDMRYGFFPSIGLGYMISNQNFWEPIRPVVNLFKLRATWGLVGNDAIAGRAGRFFYLSDIDLGGGTYRWGSSFMNSYGGYTVNRYANPDITWEQSEKWNFGFEAGLFNSLKIEGDFFRDYRSKIYMTRQNFPSSAGLEASISGNVGKVTSQGFDGSIEYQKNIGLDFWMSLRGNFTYAVNEFVELDERDYPDQYLKRLGHNINQQWGLVAERLFVDQHEIDNSPHQDYGEYMAGDIKYKDINNDGVVNSNDRVALGYPTVPEIQYGFGLSMGYKAVDFSFFFQGNAHTSFFINAGNGGIAPFVDRRNALSIIANDYWSETNPNIHAFWPRLSTEAISNNVQQSSWWLRNGGFTRLKSVELGYSPKNLESIGMRKGSRIYFSAENPLVFSPFKLWDPEMGRNGLGYPPNKRFNVGIQLMF